MQKQESAATDTEEELRESHASSEKISKPSFRVSRWVITGAFASRVSRLHPLTVVNRKGLPFKDVWVENLCVLQV